MHGSRGNGSVPSLPPPRPKSPPQYPDLYGKRRELAKIQVLERKLYFLRKMCNLLKTFNQLQDHVKSMISDEKMPWVAEFVTCNADPFISTAKKIHTPNCFWRWLCGIPCFNISSFCNCCCSPNREKPCCCDHTMCRCINPCVSCRMPECSCSSRWTSRCFNKSKCSRNCCMPQCPSCLTCSSIRHRCFPKCPKVNIGSCCNKNCCYSCCFCY